MRTWTRFNGLGLSLLAGGLALSCSDVTAGAGRQQITGPYTHRNLAVFLIHGDGRPAGRALLTLQEAMAQGKVVVHETGQVNELAVENVSPEADVFIQSGDIVKGGRQDRMISQDFIVPARSGRMPIASFCVEQGRWSRRGGEAAHAFGAASEQVVGKELKIAARRDADQGEVWKQVAAAQGKLTRSLGGGVAASPSPSSLQLTLESESVKAGVEEYVRALSARGLGKDVVGCAFAVNGRLSGAEVYASAELFARLWPKLLKAAAVEALAERTGQADAAPSVRQVSAWMAAADGAGSEEKAVSPRVKLLTRESRQNLLFETRDREQGDAWLHRSYVAK